MTKKHKKCMLSVATYNYLAKALVLANSFIAKNKGCDVLLFIPDLSNEKIKSVKWSFISSSIKLLGLNEIQNPLFQKLHLYFDNLELSCASKSFLLEHALFKCNYEKAILLDSDIFCYSSFDSVWRALDETDISVTPHTNSPLPSDGLLPDDRELTISGFINGGFWAARRTTATELILNWFTDKIVHFGFQIPDADLYADQTWMSCLPWFFPRNTLILWNVGLNVAYWNLHERKLSRRSDELFCNDEKLIFMHFSGYDENIPLCLSKYSKRQFDRETNEIVIKLTGDYGRKLNSANKSFPLLVSDYPASKFPLEKRLNKYREVWGREPKFTNKIPLSFFKSIFRKIIN